MDVIGSTIIECSIDYRGEIISTKKKWQSILTDIWRTMPITKMVQSTTFKMKISNENGKKGYYWRGDLGVSFQSKDASGTLKEILHMLKVNKYTINMSIKLKTGINILYQG